MFEIIEIIASGSFGTVLVAKERATDRMVALKVMHGAHLENDKILRRTRDEARLLQLLNHPNIVRVHELKEVDGRPVVVMEWIPGASLEEVLERHTSGIGIAEALAIARDVANALDAAHTTPGPDGSPMGVIHRDLKPPNILLSVQGVVKVVDFGVAKGQFEGRQAETVSMVLGSRGFMAPERLDGADDKPSGDVYALGLCLYELLTGKRMVMSLHPKQHEEGLEKALTVLRPSGATPATVEALRALMTSMCAYHEATRPTHAEVAGRLDEILSSGRLSPDLARFARLQISPLHNARTRIAPREHPAYADLTFLEGTAVGPSTPAAVDDQIRRFLRRDRWENELPKLRELLEANPGWTATPFLEVLDAMRVAWWRIFTREPNPLRLAAALELLAARVDERARAHARRLRTHPHPRVQKAAAALLDSGGSDDGMDRRGPRSQSPSRT